MLSIMPLKLLNDNSDAAVSHSVEDYLSDIFQKSYFNLSTVEIYVLDW